MSREGLRSRAVAAVAPLDRPLTSYYLLLGSTGLLLAIGLVMVLSTSSAVQLYGGHPPYSDFAKQLLGALAGLAMMWLLSKLPVKVFRLVAYPMLLGTIAALVIVLPFGKHVAGTERWIPIGPLTFQPSELAKLAFLIWGADLLARKERLGQLTDWRAVLVPLLPCATLIAMLVMLGNDLGTTFLLLIIFLALLWVVGVPARLFLAIGALVLFALLILVVVGSYGSGRISDFLHPMAGGPTGQNQQSIQGQWALGSGGLFGVGLGDGVQKWGWVPYANTDFIFAILGEELGLVGTACVVLLYGGLAYAGLRVARRVTEPFTRYAAVGAVAWIAGQALVNVCAVVGLLPITGVPLPLISQGLSSVIVTMAAIGMLLAFARNEPGAAEALAAVRRRRRLRFPVRSGGSHGEPGAPPAPPASGVPAEPVVPGSLYRSAGPGRGGAEVPSRLAAPGGQRSRGRPAPGPASPGRPSAGSMPQGQSSARRQPADGAARRPAQPGAAVPGGSRRGNGRPAGDQWPGRRQGPARPTGSAT